MTELAFMLVGTGMLFLGLLLGAAIGWRARGKAIERVAKNASQGVGSEP